MKVLVVIVNYQTSHLAIDCIRSLATEITQFPGSRVVVVDNDSRDDSDRRIAAAVEREGWGSWASVLQTGRNGGFAFGNNAGIRSVGSSTNPFEYVYLLNPDTRVHEGALGELVQFMDGHPQVGIAGSRLENENGVVQSAAFRFMNLPAEFEHALSIGLVSRLTARWVVAPQPRDEPHSTDWICGASMFIRGSVIEQVGLFDERFFLYYEETDFCRRAVRLGWQCWHLPTSRVIHLGGQSTGINESGRRVPSYWFASRRYYLLKHHGYMYLFAMNFVWLLGTCFRRLRRIVFNRKQNESPHVIFDFIRLSF